MYIIYRCEQELKINVAEDWTEASNTELEIGSASLQGNQMISMNLLDVNNRPSGDSHSVIR